MKNIAILGALLLASCGASAYAVEHARCAANEERIIQRQGTTLEQDEADMAIERARCNDALRAIRAELEHDGGAR